MESRTDPRPTPALLTEGLGRTFRLGPLRRPSVALADVDLRVEPGETVGLVGPNGSGKSTLLRLAAGVDRPTAGCVHVFGHGPEDRRARRRVAYLPDSLVHPPELRAHQALTLVARLRGDVGRGRALRAAVDAMLERVGLSGARRTPLGGFSRGMGRRFGLAATFLGTPDLVLLDEPTAGLDAPGFPVLEGLFDEARARGASVVIASHVTTDVLAHCDRLVLLRDGRVAREGTPDALLGDADRIELVARSSDPADLARARDALASAGLDVERAGPARRTLVDLYRGDAER